MRLTLMIFACISLFPATLFAQQGGQEYEVLSDDVFIRSGPGRQNYATGKLSPGDRVFVHRKDPGGWLVITPPQGSFDWILADNVDVIEEPQSNRPGRGLVKKPKALARIGSRLEKSRRDHYRITLSKNTSVKIIGQGMLNSPEGPRLWYKIEPPVGDRRWILGQFVQPVGKDNDGLDPFSQEGMTGENRDLPSPDQRRQRSRAFLADQKQEYDPEEKSPRKNGLVPRKMVRTQGTPRNSTKTNTIKTGPSQAELQDDRARIAALDRQFREILRRETGQWFFDDLEQNYLNLKRSAAHHVTRRHVDLRLKKMAEYQKIKTEHDAFVTLTKKSKDREAKILSMRSQQHSKGKSSTPSTAKKPRFSGAGIIQRSVGAPAGAPQHVMIAPDGKILAYLTATKGIDLDKHLGRAMGINGPRNHRAEWHTDHIRVEQLTPVRLRQ